MSDIYKPTVADRKRCRKCKHRTYITHTVCCLYVLDKREPRGCKFGVGCTKFEAGKPPKRDYLFAPITTEEVRKAREEEHRKRVEMIGYKGEALKRMRIRKEDK